MLKWIAYNRTDYLHKMDLALNNLQRLICHKTQTSSILIARYINSYTHTKYPVHDHNKRVLGTPVSEIVYSSLLRIKKCPYL